jgi:hypothetical protein
LKNTISKGQFFYFFKVILELPHVFNEMNWWVQLMKGKIDDNPMGKGYICN